MFRTLAVSFLLLVALLQCVSTSAIVVQFYLNRAYYTKNLCVNRNNPNSKCQAKCVLKQKLKNEFEQNQSNSKQALKLIFENQPVLISSELNYFTLRFGNSQRNYPKLNILYQFPDTKSFVSKIFHPPSYWI